MKFKIGDKVKTSESSINKPKEYILSGSYNGLVRQVKSLGCDLVMVTFYSPRFDKEYVFLEEDLEMNYELIRNEKLKQLGI